jgi:hypothetical protein
MRRRKAKAHRQLRAAVTDVKLCAEERAYALLPEVSVRRCSAIACARWTWGFSFTAQPRCLRCHSNRVRRMTAGR